MLSMSLKTLNIVLMCFDEKSNHMKKKREKVSNSNNKRMSKVLKIDFVLSDDKIQFLHSWANSNFGCYHDRPVLLI